MPRVADQSPSSDRRKVPRAPKSSSEATTKVMKANKRDNTKPELLVRRRLREAGLVGYRLHWKAAGRPDVAWPGQRLLLASLPPLQALHAEDQR